MTAPAPLPELTLQPYSFTVTHYIPHKSGEERDPWILDAPYQRQSVWILEQRQNLIRSLLIGIPVGVITYAALGAGRPDRKAYRVVDGKQRIETVRLFIAGGFAVPGWWWTEEDLFDPDLRAADCQVRYEDLSRRGQMRVDMGKLPANEFNSRTEYRLVKPGTGTQGNARQYVARTRTEEEMIAAEAEVYLLVNFGGVEQTAADHERARSLAEMGEALLVADDLDLSAARSAYAEANLPTADGPPF